MGKRKIVVPKEVLLEAGRASNGVDPEGYFLYRPLEAVFIWLDNKLHEGNVEFYKATVGAERKRFPEDSNLAHISRRVDFEYGASFARNYIRDLFTKPELEPNKETGRDWTLTDIIQHVRLGDYDDWLNDPVAFLNPDEQELMEQILESAEVVDEADKEIPPV